ncbi:hypothetical protein AV530_002446 [Patagioenas fasciata monilis]|uniref:Uncharacterized protein n=1 Tax=Patagioenas fasciata monilis TaxID=372326 RepID=A0A1V4K6F8_PATFA|nr:hypothetical protein AV530_002446 [Patagioenas fasciata monilis]
MDHATPSRLWCDGSTWRPRTALPGAGRESVPGVRETPAVPADERLEQQRAPSAIPAAGRGRPGLQSDMEAPGLPGAPRTSCGHFELTCSRAHTPSQTSAR